MKKLNPILQTAKETILLESKAIANLAKLLDENFEKAVNFILNSNGRVIVTGIGKSANIATKIV
ncbi:D-arabinose 5-phosphate isomerase, partial [Polaribacter sp.]|nr:D-arabinose 5-phosphate isomerase [Polaribacter sp.]